MLGILIFLSFSILLLGFMYAGSRWPVSIRQLRGFQTLRKEMERAVESGERVHLSLGTGSVIGQECAPALAGLTILARLASSTAMSDKPVIVSSANGAMMMLAQDTLADAYRKLGAETRYDSTASRMIGPTQFSYASAIPNLLDTEEVSVHILNGAFGVEGALIADFGNRENAFVLAGTDDVQSQALLFATADHPLIGEEVFAGGAYLDDRPIYLASLRTQDVVRILVIGLILIGTLLKTIGVIH
jgi:hypothetical protein